MPHRDHLTLRLLLKRGALLTAANWPIVAVQFVADAAFKILLMIPILGGALLVVLLLGGNAVELLTEGIRPALSDIATALVARPLALVFFMLALLIAVLGGSVFMFLVKGGTVTVLAAGDRVGGPLEKGSWRLESLRRASACSSDLFIEGCSRLFRRYLTLGIGLMIAYTISGALYLAIGRWLTPSGQQIEGLGVTPDIELPMTADEYIAKGDIQLFRAIDVLRGKP